MNDKQLESFLKENKPRPESDPTFILETRRRMSQVEGIKREVDRTRTGGCSAVRVALVAGIALGTIAASIAYFWPVVDPTQLDGGVIDSLRGFLTQYKQYLLFPLAIMITALCLVLTSGRKHVSERF